MASKEELMHNAKHWLNEAKRNGLSKDGIGAIFIFFDTRETGSAVCTANVDKERIAQELNVIRQKIGDKLIVDQMRHAAEQGADKNKDGQ